jgi:CubicO group peptidase (beta-lactamase class C family)
MAAAGLWTTPTDLARFAIAIQRGIEGENGPVLTASMIEEMLTPPVGDDYGLGLGIGEGRFQHGGSNEGFRCVMTAFLEDGDGVVVMTNADNGSGLIRMILSALFERFGWQGFEPEEKVVIDLDRKRLQRYVGRYVVDGFGEVELTLADPGDRLLYVLPDGSGGEMRPQSETEFFDPEDGQQIRFRIDDAAGEIVGFSGPGFEAARIK